MHGEHDDPTLSASADRPWRRAPYGMGQPPEPADAGPPPSPGTGPSNEESHDDAGRSVDDSGPAAPLYPRRYSTPTPPDNDEEDGAVWYGPDTSRVDWRAVAPAAGILATAVGLAVWAAWPDAPTEAQASPTPAPVATLRYVETRETTPTPLDSRTPYFATPTPTTTSLLDKTPSASPAPTTALPPTPHSTRKPRERAGESEVRKGDRRMSVEPDPPAAEQQQEKPRPKRTTKPRSGGDSDRPGGSTGTGTISSGGTIMDKKCDQLFPPNKPEFAIRNAACHQMYGSG
ncbi:hypothetical protein [Nonomuraea helvata]|uniref:Uncharacterized protein n=1 Tax=Nonomuraea helvata TaxID=37484 RepID=A0ABV5S601_9ACTN